jgi:cell wall-associated NlpC family hydrolase
VTPVPWDQVRPGDLVFFATDTGDITTVHHVALYVGGGLVVEAPRPGRNVRVAPVWQPGLFGAGRP